MLTYYFFSVFTAGFIFDMFGTYDLAFYLSGAIMTFGVCIMFLVPWLMPNKAELNSEESTILASEHEQWKKRAINCTKASKKIFSYPSEATFFACERHGDNLLQRSVSMEILSQSGTPPLMKSAMYRAWSAITQLHCTDSVNESSGYESDYNRQSSLSQSSEVIDNPIEENFGSVTLVTPAMSFDDLEIAVQNEKCVREGRVAGSMDMFSVLCESLLESEVDGPWGSIIETGCHGNDFSGNKNARKASMERTFSHGEILRNLEFCRETML